jgi:hypothetical protein
MHGGREHAEMVWLNIWNCGAAIMNDCVGRKIAERNVIAGLGSMERNENVAVPGLANLSEK